MIACGMALTLFLQLKQSKIDIFIISDRLCLSVLIFCTVSAIGILVKSRIGTSLAATAGWLENLHSFRGIPCKLLSFCRFFFAS